MAEKTNALIKAEEIKQKLEEVRGDEKFPNIFVKAFKSKEGADLANVSVKAYEKRGKVNQTLQMTVDENGIMERSVALFYKDKDGKYQKTDKAHMLDSLKDYWSKTWELADLQPSKAFETFKEIKDMVYSESPKKSAKEPDKTRYTVSRFENNSFFINSIDDNGLRIVLDKDGAILEDKTEYYKKGEDSDKREKLDISEVSDKTLLGLYDKIVETYGKDGFEQTTESPFEQDEVDMEM